MMKEKILKVLKESPLYVSGEQLCKSLGVSRTAVWKHIQALRAAGYVIDSQTNLGYRLQSVPDKLYPEEIQYGLKAKWFGKTIDYLDIISSTNIAAKKNAIAGAAGGSLVVAEEQNGGKGRLGRIWYSPPGLGIYCSIILRPSIAPSEAPPVTMLAAVAVAKAIEEVCDLKVGIKWPNDIMVKEKKLCGILTEMNAEMERIHYLIVGMGLNVNTEVFPDELKNIVTSIKLETGMQISRVSLLQELLYQFEQLYDAWIAEGFHPILVQWKKRCITLHRKVQMISNRETLEGWAEDVDDSGALLLRLPDGSVKHLFFGEVSLRLS